MKKAAGNLFYDRLWSACYYGVVYVVWVQQ